MNTLLNRQLDELLTNPTSSTQLKCEHALRVGAATLCRAGPNEITATTVVCDLAGDDVNALERVVQDIADEYGVEATIRQQFGSCSVHFTLPRPPATSTDTLRADKSVLARLLGR